MFVVFFVSFLQFENSFHCRSFPLSVTELDIKFRKPTWVHDLVHVIVTNLHDKYLTNFYVRSKYNM